MQRECRRARIIRGMEMANDSADTRVVQLAAGEAHTLALTASGSLYAWGRGFFGRLGTGKETDEVVPVAISLSNPVSASVSRDIDNTNIQETSPLESQKAVFVVRVAAGAYHSLALSGDGSVWSWGYNDYGQLGRKDSIGFIPGLVGFPMNANKTECEGSLYLPIDKADHVHPCDFKVVAVEAGGMMSCAVDQNGKLWMWGQCPNASSKEESISTLFLIERPMCIKGLERFCVSRVACGNEHVVVIAVSELTGENAPVLFSWGNNSHGQLGLGDTKNRSSPQCIDSIKKLSTGYPFDISCGAFHSAVLVASRPARSYFDESYSLAEVASTACWTFGEGENGQLGHGTSAPSLLPVCMELLPVEEKWVRVACGLFHTAVVSERGEVWVCGMQNGVGLLPGIKPSQYKSGDALVPYKIFGETSVGQIPSFSPRELVCGAAHTVTLAQGGSRIFSWGRGQNGVLGTGQLMDSWIPCPVVWPPLDQMLDPQNSKPVSEENISDTEIINHKQTRNLKIDMKSKTKHELEAGLSAALEENLALKRELEFFKVRAESLHFAVYGGIQTLYKQYLEILPVADPESHGLPTFSDAGAAQEWQKTMYAANYADLLKYESFYKAMHTQVEDLLLQKKVENCCSLYLRTLSAPKASSSEHINSHGSSSQKYFVANENDSVPSNQELYSTEELKNLTMRLKKL